MQVNYGQFKIETCKKCGRIVGQIDTQTHKIVKALRHIQCKTCGNIVCSACTTSIKNMRKVSPQHCPVCGSDGKND